MLRRCLSELSSARSARMMRKRIVCPMPFLLSSRNEFSSASSRNQSQGPTVKPSAEKPTPQGNFVPKAVLGSVVLGAAIFAAYRAGYIEQLRKKDEKSSPESIRLDSIKTSEELKHLAGEEFPYTGESPTTLKPDQDIAENKDEIYQPKDLEISQANTADEKPTEESFTVKEHDSAIIVQDSLPPAAEHTVNSRIVSEDSLNVNNSIGHADESMKQIDAAEGSTVQNEETDHSNTIPEEVGMGADAHHQDVHVEEVPKVSIDHEREEHKSLAQLYSLQEDKEFSEISEKEETAGVLPSKQVDKEASLFKSEDSKETDKSEYGRVLLDLIDAIHVAERKQAEADAFVFAEEKRKLKEKYEMELKDARARELMYAEEAAILDKELNKEKARAAAMVKMLEEKAQKHLQEELKHKEEEAEVELKKVQDLAKAELSAAIVNEKSSQIEKIAEANLHINALCMAFYARSEEARQSHSIHKLALGTLALEDALSKGVPIKAEIDALHKSLEGIDRDSLLSLVLSSLSEETLNSGTCTQMLLKQKFESLKGLLRHFSLIPAGGGGILAHSVAHIASLLKMKEDESGNGIEALISRVERFIVEGKLAEAADALEGGLQGSEAEGVVVEWVRQARNRAIAEQVLSLIQAYASSITFA